MDSTTTDECLELENNLNKLLNNNLNNNLQNITGSRAFERFTASQIIKMYKKNKNVWENCDKICLLSCGLTSLFCNEIVPMDLSDACGMNLLDIHTNKWSNDIIKAININNFKYLIGKEPIPSYKIVSNNINNYFINKFKFNKDCKILGFTGDNPSSVIGLNLKNEGDLAISLGNNNKTYSIFFFYNNNITK